MFEMPVVLGFIGASIWAAATNRDGVLKALFAVGFVCFIIGVVQSGGRSCEVYGNGVTRCD